MANIRREDVAFPDSTFTIKDASGPPTDVEEANAASFLLVVESANATLSPIIGHDLGHGISDMYIPTKDAYVTYHGLDWYPREGGYTIPDMWRKTMPLTPSFIPDLPQSDFGWPNCYAIYLVLK